MAQTESRGVQRARTVYYDDLDDLEEALNQAIRKGATR
jgi:hypothetical protein